MSDRLRVLIIDDEPLALGHIVNLVKGIDGLEVVGTASNGDAALAEIERLCPDLVILDVEMPGPDGLVIAAALAELEACDVVIVSAFDRYAAAAFEIDAVDYIVKPAASDRLVQSIARARRRRAERAAIAAVDDHRDDLAIIHLPNRHGGTDVSALDIIWIEAARDYAILHLRTRTHILRITMTDIAAMLPATFLRIHRSTYVNLTEVRRWGATLKGVSHLLLSDGASVAIGPTYYPDVIDALRWVPE